MKVDLGIWGKLTRLVSFLFILAGVLLVAAWYLPLIQQNERMRREIQRLDAQIQRQNEIGRQLKADGDALRYDPRAVERLARERLGYAKAGETVIRFEDSPARQTAVQ